MNDGNGSNVTRAELSAHIRRIDERLESIDTRLGGIERAVAAPRHWVNERVTRLVDRGLPVLLVAVVTFLIAH